MRNADRDTARLALLSGIPVGISFASALVFFFLAFWTSEWRAGPSGDDVIEVVAGPYSEEQVELWLLEEIVASIDENRERDATKTKWATWTVISTMIEVVAASLALLAIAISAFIEAGD